MLCRMYRHTVSFFCPYCQERIITILDRFRRPFYCHGCGTRLEVAGGLEQLERKYLHFRGMPTKATVETVIGIERDEDPATGRPVGEEWFGKELDRWGRPKNLNE